MQHVVTGLFDTQSDAERARESLITAGVEPTQITLVPGQEPTRPTQSEGGFWQTLKDMFMPEEDRQTYAEGLRRGAVMVSVDTDETRIQSVEDVLERAGAIDLHERETAWRTEGWQGGEQVSDRISMGVTQPSPNEGDHLQSRHRGPASEHPVGEQSIPVLEEQLRVGKRVASEGRVRVRSYVVERPVQERVDLRQDNVMVERRAVDRPVQSGEKAFQERTVEVEGKREEPVVSKETRVKEEVVLKKQPAHRTETVADTVRETRVEVEDERAESPVTPTSRR
jgi:uncharacterized protein (TIGR02271 family)